jgi:hypothetical protein
MDISERILESYEGLESRDTSFTPH